MVWKRLVIVALVVGIVGVCSISGSPIERCQAATQVIVRYRPDGVAIRYGVVYEKSSGEFRLDEHNTCFNHTITGKAYVVVDKSGTVTGVRVAVDSATNTFWGEAENEEKNEQIDKLWHDLGVAVSDVAGLGGPGLLAFPLSKELSLGSDLIAGRIAACYKSTNVMLPWSMLRAQEMDVCREVALTIIRTYGYKHLKRVTG